MNFPSDEFIPFTVDVPRALEVLATHLFHDPKQFIREIVSNAVDACSVPRDSGPLIEITFTARRPVILVIKDSGTGMSREVIRQVLPAFFGTTKRGDSSQIGQFGVGLYSALQYAERVEVISKSEKDASGTATTMTSFGGGVFVSDCDCEIGTEVRVHLSTEAPPILRDIAGLREYVAEVFLFSPVDINFNGKIIAGPTKTLPPWQPKASSVAWPTYLDRPLGRRSGTPRVANAIYHSETNADFALFMPETSLREEFKDIRLYCRRVYVSSFPLPGEISALGTCVAGVVNSSDVSLTLDRQNALTENGQFDTLVSQLLCRFREGFVGWWDRAPRHAVRYSIEHRTALLELAVNRQKECGAFLPLLPFTNIAGEWISARQIASSNQGAVAYAFEDSAPSLLEIGSTRARQTLLFSSDVEIKACAILLKQIDNKIRWGQITKGDSQRRVDPLSTVATSMLNVALANPIKVIRQGEEISVASWSGNRKPVRAEVLSDSRKEASWIEPVSVEGVDIADAWRQAMEELKDQDAHSVSVRCRLHQKAYAPVLRLNQNSDVVRWLFKLHSSGKADDASLARIIFNLLMRSAVHASAHEWYVYFGDHEMAVKAMLDACEYLLLVHEEVSAKNDE